MHFFPLETGDEMVTDMLIMNCVDDITKMQEPWPLHIAAEYGNLFKIEYGFWENNLIEKCLGRENIVKKLIAKGIDVNLRNRNNDTALNVAAEFGNIQRNLKIPKQSGLKNGFNF